MSGLLLRKCLWIGLVLSVLGLCFFGDGSPAKSSQVLGPALAEITAVLADPGTQWMVFVCAAMYLLAFVILRRRLAGGGEGGAGDAVDGRWKMEDRASVVRAGWGLAAQGLGQPAFWLTGLMVLAAVAYAFDYTQSAKSTQALTSIGAAMVAQGAALWEGGRQKAEGRNGGSRTVSVLIVLLLGAAVWQAETEQLFQYRGQARWAGPWDNPNTFGVLMGVGLVLAVGKLVQSLKPKVQSLELKGQGPEFEFQTLPNAEHRTSNIQHPVLNWGLWVKGAFFLGAAAVMGVGLVKSYSRGAWVGAAVGVAYLAFHIGKAEMLKTEKLKGGWSGGKAESRKLKAEIRPGVLRRAGRRWGAFLIIFASVGVLAFWSFRHTDRAVVRRTYTVANANDFSWRNRVAAWEGALQMMAERPWLGFGWNQPERVYDQYYRATKLNEGMAIQLNDYFIMGTTLGVPALLCFAMYVGL